MLDVNLVVRMTPVSAFYAGFYDRIPKALGASRILAAGMAPRVETLNFAVEVGLSSFLLNACSLAYSRSNYRDGLQFWQPAEGAGLNDGVGVSLGWAISCGQLACT